MTKVDIKGLRNIASTLFLMDDAMNRHSEELLQNDDIRDMRYFDEAHHSIEDARLNLEKFVDQIEKRIARKSP